MILVDTGPLVALFDPQDGQHARCVKALKEIREPIMTTTPVLTEAFHMLGPASIGSDRLRDFIETGGLSVWFFDRHALTRAFELMERTRIIRWIWRPHRWLLRQRGSVRDACSPSIGTTSRPIEYVEAIAISRYR